MQRPLSVLELFVLAMLRQGLTTPYRLMVDGGVSLGASLPVLHRLEQAGLVRKGSRGGRRKQEFDLTATGRAALSRGLRNLSAAAVPADAESVLRLVALMVVHGQRRAAVRFLDQAAKQWRRALAEATASLKGDAGSGNYPALKAFMDMRRAQADAATFAAIRRALRKRPPN